MNNVVLNVTQAFQLAALGPCIFVIVYLLFSARNYSRIIIPELYFISLTCSFLLPVIAVFPEINHEKIETILLFNEHLGPELSFLLILQFILGRPPPLIYWSILALPLIGGGPFLYLSVTENEVCFYEDGCIPAENLMVLYRVFGASLVFVLLTVLMNKMPPIQKGDSDRKHKYWLIIMLIVFNLIILGVDLLLLAERINIDDALFVRTMIGIGFVYLVLSSVFSVFSKSLSISPLKYVFSERDRELADKIERLLEHDKPYRSLGFNRGKLADVLGLTEQHLSRIINHHFQQSFSGLMNKYRVKDAEDMLINSVDPITTISFNVGFSSITSFNRVFKQATGIPPSEYREKAKQKG